MIGKTLAQYQITQKLGAGGMGVVYRARDTKLGRDVALKFLPAAEAGNRSAHARLLEEARMASALNHPNICTIYEVNEIEGQAFAAMELVEGRPLRATIPAEGLPIELLVRYGAQIADAVSFAHDHGVIHRDIKTANVMVTPEGRVKVLDFGLAQRAASEADLATRGGVSAARDSLVAGTLHYLAPEVLRGERADARSDIWALGVVLYEMAAGRLPYDAASSYELTSAILRDPLPPLLVRVPAGLRAVIQRCLAREPGQRYQRAGEVRAALEAVSSSDLAIPSVPAAVRTTPKSGRAIRLVAGLVVATLAVAAWLAWQRRGQPSEKDTATAKLSVGARTSTNAIPSANPEANEYFEKGMYFLATQVDVPKARQMYERAIQLDPKFAEARGWLGFSMFLMVDMGHSNDPVWLYRAEEQVRQTLAEDPQNGHAHTTLAALQYYRGNRELMKEELDKALAINPDDFDGQMGKAAYYFGWMGDYAEALRTLRPLSERNPLNTIVRANLAEVLRDKGDFTAAIREFEKVREQDPRSPFLPGLARAYMYAGDLAAARKIFAGMRPSERRTFICRMNQAILLAREGQTAQAAREMDESALKFGALSPWSTMFVTEYHAILGNSERALEWLDLAVRMGDERAEWFQLNPHLASIRNHPRFKQIIESVLYRRQQREQKTVPAKQP